MPSATIAPDDHKAFSTVLLSAQRTAIDRARLVTEFIAVMQVKSGSSRADYRDAMVDARTRFDRKAGGRDGIHDVADVIKSGLDGLSVVGDGIDALTAVLPAGGLAKLAIDPATFLHSLADGGTTLLETPFVADYIREVRARNGAAFTAQATDAYASSVDAVAALVMKEAESNPELAKAIHDAHPEALPTERDAITAGACVRDHPELFPINVTIRPDNSVIIHDVDQAREDILAEIGAVGASTQSALSEVKGKLDAINESNAEISKGVGGILVILENKEVAEREHEKQEALRREAAALVDGIWDTAGSSLAAASAVAALLGDAKLSKDINRFGSAAVTLTKAVVGLVNATTAISAGLSAVTALGAAAATGNFIAAAGTLLQIVSSADEPTPEQMILDGIGQLQSQLGELRSELTEGINRLDEHLDQIYSSVMSALSSIAATANMTLVEARRISRQLAEQSLLVEQLLAETGVWFRAAERAELSSDIRTALHWRLNNEAPLGAQEFGIFSGHFHTWAVETAFDEINQPVENRPTDLASAARELGGSFPDNVSYVNRLLMASGLPSLGDDPIPNLQMWSLSALAFAQLRAEWPSLARDDDPRLREIRDVGVGLSARLHDLAVDRSLFPAVMADYRQAGEAFIDAIMRFKERFEGEHVLRRLGYAIGDPHLTANIDLLTDAAGQNGFTLEEAVTEVDGPAGIKSSPVPAVLINAVPYECWLADYLNPNSRKVNYNWIASSAEKIVEHRNPKTHEVEVIKTWLLTVEVRVCFDRDLIAAFTWSTACDESTNPVTAVAASWHTISAELDRGLGQPVPTPPDLWRKQAHDLSNPVLDDLRSLLATVVAEEVRSSSGDLFVAARRLDGTRLVIDYMVRLLFPIPRYGDDLLRAILDGSRRSDGGIRLPTSEDLVAQLPTKVPERVWYVTHGPGSLLPIISLPIWFAGLADRATAMLSERVEAWQDAIHAGDFSNPNPTIDDTLARLAAAEVVRHSSIAVGKVLTSTAEGLARLQTAVRVSQEPQRWTPDLADALLLVRRAAYERQLPGELGELRLRITSRRSGAWSEADVKALRRCVTLIQEEIGAKPDGDWGPRTDARYQALRKVMEFAWR